MTAVLFVSPNVQTAAGASSTAALAPAADSYVNSGEASTNYGSAASMVTKQSTSNDRSAYLKFNFNSLSGTVSSAKLRLYVKSMSAAASRTAYAVASDSWTEAGLTYSNMPAFGNPLGNVNIKANGWVEIDVTSYVMAEHAGDKVASIYVKDPIVNNNVGIDFYSKENGLNGPELVVITEPNGPNPVPSS